MSVGDAVQHPPCRTSRMSLRLAVAVTQHPQPSVRPARCSVAVENVSTRSGGVMETATARMAQMKPTVVRASQQSLS